MWLELAGIQKVFGVNTSEEPPYSSVKCKSKQLLGSILYPSESLRSKEKKKTQEIAHASKDMEQWEHSPVAGGSTN